MTVSTTTSRVEYSGNGSTTVFSVPFYFLANGDLKVYQAGTLKTITTHYSVSGAGVPAGGTVTFVTAPANGDDVVIFRDPAITQQVDYAPNDPFPAETHEQALDRLTMIAQRGRDLLDRSVRIPDGEAGEPSLEVPALASRINKTFYWNASGEPSVADVSAATLTFSPDIQLFNGDGSTTAFTLTESPGSSAALVVAIDGVLQKPGSDFSTAGTTLTFVSAPPSGTGNVAVQSFGFARAVDTMDADGVTYTPNGSGAVNRDVQTKLREFVSVQDYGAAGDGVTNDAPAFNRAAAIGRPILLLKPSVSYKLDTVPSGTYFALEEIPLVGSGSTLTIKTLVGYSNQNDVCDVPGPVTITANNVGGFRQRDEFGNDSNLASIDSDGNAVLGPTDPRMFNLFSVPTNGKKHFYVEAHDFVDLSALAATELHAVFAARGCYEAQVSSGSSITDLQGNGRGMIKIASGSGASEAGWLLDFKNMQVTVDSFTLLEFMYDMPDSLQQRLEFGLWDGTLNNAIYCERAEAGTGAGLVAKTISGGSGTSNAMTVGNDALRHSIRIFKRSSTQIEFYDSNSDVAAGQFQLKTTNTTNIPSASIRPFIRFRSLGGTYDRSMRWDKLSVLANW